MELRDYQEQAVEDLDNGKILYGPTGAGKSFTAAAYYMKKEAPRDVFVITTAKKRDSGDWWKEFVQFGVGVSRDATVAGVLTVDSWNNIGKYIDVKDAFFVFDEQRLVGGPKGAWVKAFQKIAKKNRWILLSATPGDTWLDYIPVFVANGFYKSAADFKEKHVVYEPWSRFPKVKMYVGETKLQLLRNHLLVEMDYQKHTERVINWIDVSFDKDLFRRVWVDRWHIYEERPIVDVAELFRVARRVVWSDPSRLEFIHKLMKTHPKLIIFYNYNYELEILRTIQGVAIGEWNGHRKNPIPATDRWVYLVQYIAGAEGWNCTETDAMVLYSPTYSFKNFEQAKGRIDRMNTPFDTLYYYILLSNSLTDLGIQRSLEGKRDFNERKFVSEMVGFKPFPEKNVN